MKIRCLSASTATTALISLPLAVVGLSTGTANAANHDFQDGRGDVWKGNNTSAPMKVGTQANVDVLSSTVSYNNTALKFVVQYTALTAGRFRASLGETIKRKDGTYLNAAVDTKDDAQGVATIDTPCPGIKTVVNYHDDVLTLTIPTSCVGKQAWVKVKGSAVGTLKGDSEEYYIDDLQDHGSEPDTYSAKILRA